MNLAKSLGSVGGLTLVSRVLALVRDAEPEPPSRVNPRAPRDLQTIALKCLEKAPKDRYSSAAAVADDLNRWLDGRPIAARPMRGPRPSG